MEDCSTNNSSSRRKKKEDTLALLQKLLPPKVNKHKTPRTFEYKRSSNTGKRIYKPKVQPRKKYKKTTGNLQISSTKDIPFDDEDALIYEAETDGNIDYFVSMDNNKNLVKDNAELNSVHECLQTLKRLLPAPKKRHRKSWFHRVITTQNQWARIRPVIKDVMLSREVPKGVCNICQEREVVIKCNMCLESFLCYVCDDIIHTSNPVHDRSFISKGITTTLSPLEIVDDNFEIVQTERFPKIKCFSCSSCGSKNLVKRCSKDMCAVITMHGRFDLFKFSQFCEDCRNIMDPFDIEYLLKCGYWPGTPLSSPNYIIDENVFIVWDAFRKRMPGSSEKSFLMCLSDLSEENGRSGVISQITFSMCFKEWNFWVYERDNIQGKNWLECPSCEVNQHSCHVDGNAKLYRYKSSGRRKRPTFYVNGLFSSNDKVEKYIRKIYGEKRGTNKIETDYHCGGVWNAAKNAKKKTNSLDETGIELASCRHRIAQKALNMFQGELFGYPLYLMKTFMAEKNVKFCFADVMCKLWKFVKQHEPSLPSLLRPALSVMHAKGHALNCQILWSGEWLEGTGKSTGEETEQVFGYLSRCGNTTKHQTPENREETITEMAMFWNKRKILNIIKELSRRFLKCKHDIVKADDALTKVKQDTGLHEMEKEVDKWINDMKVSASGFLSNAVNRKLTSNEKFVLLLDDMQHLPCAAPFLVLLDGLHFPKSIKKGYYYRFLEFGLEEKQHELQRLLNIPACIESILESYSLLKNDIWKPIYQREIDKAFMVKVSWGMQIKKIADTSKRRHVVRAKFGVADKALKELIVDYCRVYSIENVEEVFRCCETGEFPWIGISSRGEPSATDRQLCAELTQKKRRLVEELELLSTDMKSCMKYYCLKVETLNSRIKDFEKQISQSGSMNDEEDPHDLENSQALFGELILMRKGLLFYQNCLEKAVSVFQKCINLGNVEILQNSETEGDGDECDSEDDNARDNDFDMLDKESTSDVEEVYFPNNEVNSEFVLAVGIELAQGYKKDPLVVKEDSHTKTCMCPLSLCQSLLNNTNGSNACVVISLIMGYMLTKNPTVFSNLQVNHDSSCFLSIFCGAIEVGNYLYTKNSMEGFLTVVEGLDILPEYFNLTIQEEFNCNMDENDNSFLKYLREIQVTDTNNFVITVARGKSMCWTITKDGIFCIDSHRNGCYGGKVVRLKNIDDQINTVILDIISDPFFYYCSIAVS